MRDAEHAGGSRFGIPQDICSHSVAAPKTKRANLIALWLGPIKTLRLRVPVLKFYRTFGT